MADNPITNSFPKKIMESYKKHEDLILKIIFFICIIGIGMIMRYKLFPHLSADTSRFLIPWYNYIKEHGGFKAVGDKIGDYTPMYYYFMAALTYTKLEINTGLKLISTTFDLIMAVYVMKIVRLKYPKGSHLPELAFGVAFCLPTVVINSSQWGQCDVIYVTFLIICLYYILCGKDRLAMIMFGISFSFKLQSIFLLPLIGILMMRGKMRFRMLLWIPIVYVISIIPATIAGGDFIRLLTVYFSQSGQYSKLTLNLPNIWSFLDGISDNNLSSAGVFFAGAVVFMMMYYYITNKKMKITRNTVIGMALMSAFMVPFVLPHMHERYMYLSEILFVIFAFTYKKRAYLIATSQFCTVPFLLRFLYKQTPMDIRWICLIEAINLFLVFYTLRNEVENPEDTECITASFETPETSVSE